MPHHHCCILGCRSDSRYSPRDSLQPLRFFCVPSITSKKSLHSQWLEQIGRPDLIVSRNTRVCSRHFVDGRPTKDNPHPTQELECYPYRRSRIHSSVRPYPKVRTVDANDTNHALNHNSALKCKSPPSSPSSSSLNDESSQYQQYNYYNEEEVGVEIPETVIHEFKQTQTDLQQEDKCTQTMGMPCVPRVLWDYPCHRCQCKSGTKPGFQLNRALQSEPFSIDKLKHNEEKLQFYTGLQSHGAFQGLLEELRPKLSRRSLPCDENMCDLPLDDQLLIALMAQRLKLLSQDLAYRFHVTSRIVDSVCSKWGPLLERHFNRPLL